MVMQDMCATMMLYNVRIVPKCKNNLNINYFGRAPFDSIHQQLYLGMVEGEFGTNLHYMTYGLRWFCSQGHDVGQLVAVVVWQ